jgi:hypothetical protein
MTGVLRPLGLTKVLLPSRTIVCSCVGTGLDSITRSEMMTGLQGSFPNMRERKDRRGGLGHSTTQGSGGQTGAGQQVSAGLPSFAGVLTVVTPSGITASFSAFGIAFDEVDAVSTFEDASDLGV